MADPSEGGTTPHETWITRAPVPPEEKATRSDRPEDIPETIASPAGGAASRSPEHMPHVPGYEILGELGRGGMGVVYKAKQTKLNRIVALKMILSADSAGEAHLARFRTEAEAIARLQHPGIVQV